MTQTTSGHHNVDEMEMDEDKRDLLVAAFLEQQQHLHHDHYDVSSDLSINQQMTSPGGQDPDLIPLSSKLLMYHHHEDDGSNGNNSDCLGSSLTSNDQSRSLLLLRNSSLLPNSVQGESMMVHLTSASTTFPQDHHHGMDSEVYEAGQQLQQSSSLTTGRVTGQQHDSEADCMSGLLGPPPEIVMNAAMSSGPLYLTHQHHLQGTSSLCHPTSSSSSSHEMNLKSVVSGQNHHHHPTHLQQQPLHSILKTSTSQSIFPPLPPTSSSSLSTNLNIFVPPAVLSGFSGNSYSSPSASTASSSSFVTSVHLQQHPYSTVTDFEVW